MRLDDAVKNAYNDEAAEYNLSQKKHAEILNMIHQVPVRRENVKMNKKLHTEDAAVIKRLRDFLEVAAIIIIMIMIPVLVNRYSQSNRQYSSTDNQSILPVATNNTGIGIKDSEATQVKPAIQEVTGQGLVLTIFSPKAKDEKLYIGKDEIDFLMQKLWENSAEAIAINDVRVSKESKVRSGKDKGSILIDGKELSVNEKVTFNIIGDTTKIYELLMFPNTLGFGVFLNYEARIEKNVFVSIPSSVSNEPSTSSEALTAPNKSDTQKSNIEEARNFEASLKNGSVISITRDNNKELEIYNIEVLDKFIEDYTNHKECYVRIIKGSLVDGKLLVNKLEELESDGNIIIDTGYDCYKNKDTFTPVNPTNFPKIGKIETGTSLRYTLCPTSETPDDNGATLISFDKISIKN